MGLEAHRPDDHLCVLLDVPWEPDIHMIHIDNHISKRALPRLARDRNNAWRVGEKVVVFGAHTLVLSDNTVNACGE